MNAITGADELFSDPELRRNHQLVVASEALRKEYREVRKAVGADELQAHGMVTGEPCR